MSRPALTARGVRGLRYLLRRLGDGGRPALRVFGDLPPTKDAELLAALVYVQQLCDWHEGRECGARKTGRVCRLPTGHDGPHELTDDTGGR